MTVRLLWTLACIFCLCCAASSVSSVDGEHFPAEKSKRCFRQRSHGKIASFCHDKQLSSVPSNLNTDIQILDLSFNRIRELESDSFSRYTSLELLYLDDNMITHIADDAFLPLQRLEVLVLSLNGIGQVPTSLLALPNLWKLDLSQNRFLAGGLDVFGNAPLTNNLKWLSLVSCHLHLLPPLDNFPRLLHLNVSDNPLERLGVEQLAPTCSLKTLDLGASRTLLPPCDCLLLARWAEDGGITILPAETNDCAGAADADEEECHSSNATHQAQELRAQCGQVLEVQAQRAHMMKVWIYVGAALAACIGTALIVAYWVRRRRRARCLHANNNSPSTDKPGAEASLLAPR